MSWVNESNGLGVLREQIAKLFVMKEEGMFTASDGEIEARVTALLADFEVQGHKLDLFPSVWACLDEFGRFYTEPKFAVDTATFQMSIQRKIGNDTIALGMTITTKASTASEREQAYFLLEREIEARFRSIYVMRGKPTDASQEGSQTQGMETDVFATTRLSHDFVDGKHRVRLHGGRWEKFGVPVYPEILAKMGLTVESVPLGSQPYIGVATCQMNQGKPTRILNFQASAQA